MRDYAKVAPTFWSRGSGKKLRGDPDAQVLALYLVTCPAANMTGVFRLPLSTICHDTGLTAEHAIAALGRLEREEVAFYDHSVGIVWVPDVASTDKSRARAVLLWERRTSSDFERVLATRLRLAVIERDGLRCHLCGGDVPRSDIHVDHVVPLARGGRSTLDNLSVAHSRCNLVKGAK